MSTPPQFHWEYNNLHLKRGLAYGSYCDTVCCLYTVIRLTLVYMIVEEPPKKCPPCTTGFICNNDTLQCEGKLHLIIYYSTFVLTNFFYFCVLTLKIILLLVSCLFLVYVPTVDI